jgi:hypothetical protein
MNTSIETWMTEAEALAELLENFPARLLAVATLPPSNDPQALLRALLAARKAFGLPSYNASLTPAQDRLVQLPEHFRHPLSNVFTSIERALHQCVAAGARDPSLIAASDFKSALMTVDVPGVLHRVLLGDVRALSEQHPVRQALPLADAYQSNGTSCVVLGRVLGGGFPGDALPLRPGTWYDAGECLANTRRWRQSQLAREQEARDQLEREKAGRAERLALARLGR